MKAKDHDGLSSKLLPMTGVFVKKMEDIQFQKVQLTNNAIIAFIKVNGEINISIDGLN
jgi:hypothetical protein